MKNYLFHIERLFIARLQRCDAYKADAEFYARHLIGLFCTSMSFCLIHSETQRQQHIANGIKVILNKKG